jgi:hypothetical protein
VGYGQYPNADDHEVRERDYFFVVSFVVWGLWAGIGALSLLQRLAGDPRRARLLAAPALAVVALLPVGSNWSAASRRHGPDARLAADFAYDLLNSAPPYGILFTYGDNDTFPLWWAQEVAGIRRDVTVVCLALANTDWYMRQLRDNATRPADPASMPPIWRDSIPATPDWPLHGMTDSMIGRAMEGFYVPHDQTITLGPLRRELKAGSVLYPNDIVSLSLIQQNIGRRPIVWAVTAGRGFAGLGDHVVQRGLGFQLTPAMPDTTEPRFDLRRLAGAPLDVPATETLAYRVYRYAGLLDGGAAGLDPTAASAAASLSLPFVQLAYAHLGRGDTAGARRAVEHGVKLSPNPEMRDALRQLLLQPPPDSSPLGE